MSKESKKSGWSSRLRSSKIKDGLLSKVLKKKASVPEYIVPPQTFRASQAYGSCLWAEVFKGVLLKGKQVADSELPLNNVLAMKIGTDIHAFIQDDLLGPLGVLLGDWVCSKCTHVHELCFYPKECEKCGNKRFTYGEISLISEDKYKFSGHLDGIVCFNRLTALLKDEPLTDDIPQDLVHLEIKSSNEYAFDALVSTGMPAIYYQWQANIYHHLLEVDRTVFLYLNVANKDLADILYHHDPLIMEECKEKAALQWECIEAKKMPPAKWKKCKTHKSKDAKTCPFRDRCFFCDEGKELEEGE